MSSKSRLPRSLFCAWLGCASLLALARPAVGAPAVDWQRTADEALQTLIQYIRLNTTNPPGDTRQTADYLAGILKSSGLTVTRYESAPGRAMLYARLSATTRPAAGKPIILLHHMDVVPADASRWPVDPFAAVLKDGMIWGRGAIDM